ncbi:hypothetical protein AG1IA_04346 [Rhizoctonia solani AG-1 IA]|uniref:Uncharacterized protein n=1 Tax=Thanatephorus cucumeris (strain AG1-IA) TaxID=983506 RepID=L8WTZ4_THACA|nr:hypothetical protein AG1IA_04346 [Rhizoctonia solani AG-1 IA]
MRLPRGFGPRFKSPPPLSSRDRKVKGLSWLEDYDHHASDRVRFCSTETWSTLEQSDIDSSPVMNSDRQRIDRVICTGSNYKSYTPLPAYQGSIAGQMGSRPGRFMSIQSDMGGDSQSDNRR